MSSSGDNYGVQFGDSANVSGGVIAGAGSRVESNQYQGASDLAELQDLRARRSATCVPCRCRRSRRARRDSGVGTARGAQGPAEQAHSGRPAECPDGWGAKFGHACDCGAGHPTRRHRTAVIQAVTNRPGRKHGNWTEVARSGIRRRSGPGKG